MPGYKLAVHQPSKDVMSKVSKFLCTHHLNSSSVVLFHNSFYYRDYVGRKSIHRKKLKRIPSFGYFRVFKEYPQKSQIWEIETNPNQGIPNQVPKLGFVSLSQIWDFCGYPLNTLKYQKLGIRYFFLCTGKVKVPAERR